MDPRPRTTATGAPANLSTLLTLALNTLDLLAVVGGNEVTNPFVVTEAHDLHPESWALAALSFTRLLTP